MDITDGFNFAEVSRIAEDLHNKGLSAGGITTATSIIRSLSSMSFLLDETKDPWSSSPSSMGGAILQLSLDNINGAFQVSETTKVDNPKKQRKPRVKSPVVQPSSSSEESSPIPQKQEKKEKEPVSKKKNPVVPPPPSPDKDPLPSPASREEKKKKKKKERDAAPKKHKNLNVPPPPPSTSSEEESESPSSRKQENEKNLETREEKLKGFMDTVKTFIPVDEESKLRMEDLIRDVIVLNFATENPVVLDNAEGGALTLPRLREKIQEDPGLSARLDVFWDKYKAKVLKEREDEVLEEFRGDIMAYWTDDTEEIKPVTKSDINAIKGILEGNYFGFPPMDTLARFVKPDTLNLRMAPARKGHRPALQKTPEADFYRDVLSALTRLVDVEFPSWYRDFLMLRKEEDDDGNVKYKEALLYLLAFKAVTSIRISPYLTPKLKEFIYGIDIGRVKEVLSKFLNSNGDA